MKLSFVIPCYRSAQSVGNVVTRIIDTVQKDGRYDYEIICVNDYSPDNTLDVLRELAAGNRRIKVIALTRNFGQHSALMAGFNHVSGDVVVCMDDDGQNPPEEMFKLIDKLDEGYDLVSARYSNKKHSLFRRFGSKVSMAMSTYCPWPVRSRWCTAAKIPTTVFIEPTAMSAICILVSIGPVTLRPAAAITPERDR